MSRPPTRLVSRLKGSHHKSGGLNPQDPLGGVHARPRRLEVVVSQLRGDRLAGAADARGDLLVAQSLGQLTFDAAIDDFPLWTPDGARVVFRSTRDDGGLFWKAADGTGQVEQLKDGLARPYAWAEDGRLIFDQAADIGVLTIEGERTEEVLLDTEYNETHPALSPDGRWLAYLSDETGQTRIYVKPFPNVDDGQWNVSLGTGRFPIWSPDGRELFYVTQTDLMVARLETQPTFSSGTPEPLFRVDRPSMGGFVEGRRFDIAPDGNRFILRKPMATETAGDATFNGLIVVEHWFEELTARVPVQ